MNNTKIIFKSLLIMIVAISLFTVSCSKDEGGTTTPTTPAKPITITGQNITDALKKIPDITIGKTKISFSAIVGRATIEITGTALTSGGSDTMITQADLQTKIKDGLKVSGATVDAKVTGTVPTIDKTDNITVTITITPASGNSFSTTELTPYTKTGNDVVVKLTLKPQNTKKWDGQ
ncbi:hypothetical protein EPJ69_09250 [Brachyspira aalborgi]|uniref:Lipoprotein n=1 Tax=Brachyspira aalborgi TaxID=29522 RepID=A0A5C8E3N2_9SPIR|nr:hypothetical protein [Brachyspira aalborgi]TXJ31012.1 hypothetical protein EPJ69_09250 [Brachyspira aalborgi]